MSASKQTNKRVLVALSGGMDSAVAAALLKTQGYEVIGLHMQFWDKTKIADIPPGGSCCRYVDPDKVAKVCAQLEISFQIMDAQEQFQNDVVDYMVHEYLMARVPNPCCKCNSTVKFDALLKKADELHCDLVATGHYAKVVRNAEGSESTLLRAVDREKDQTYYLFGLKQSQLARALMPLGDLLQSNVVKMAQTFGLPAEAKAAIQPICFVDNTGYREIVAACAPERYRPGGPIVDREGAMVGRHLGLFNYRVGQRKVLGADSPENSKKVVIGFDTRMNGLIVGDEPELYHSTLVATDCNWIGGQDFSRGMKVKARIRAHHHEEAACILTLLNNNSVHVEFEKPQLAIMSGQAIVFYQEDILVGGGWIDSLIPPVLSKLTKRQTFAVAADTKK
ncbi:MAG: tRNA 2-thiouridine(34) synthase MnmA [Deltaproteobacteria bacterium]|nr:tRNA 2-thiouridine(34) synthase MnmA [Deltaproteobacteria bacterium]